MQALGNSEKQLPLQRLISPTYYWDFHGDIPYNYVLNLFWHCSWNPKAISKSTGKVWSQDKNSGFTLLWAFIVCFSPERRWNGKCRSSNSRPQCLSSILDSFFLPAVMDQWLHFSMAQFSIKSDGMANTNFITMMVVKSINSYIIQSYCNMYRIIDHIFVLLSL